MAITDEFLVNFTSVQEELEYWKRQAYHYRQAFLEAEEELDEFKESSKDLEKELESMLEMSEDELKDARQVNAKLKEECEILREKLNMLQKENLKHIADLETKLSAANALSLENAKHIRRLEQSNDDLERTNRTQIGTIEDLEERLNDIMETNAFLEDELDEKRELCTTAQRLRDEVRDLSQELSALRKKDKAEEKRLVRCEEPTLYPPTEFLEPRTKSRGRFLQSCRSLFCRICQRLQPNKKVAMKLYSSSRPTIVDFKSETPEMTFDDFVLIEFTSGYATLSTCHG